MISSGECAEVLQCKNKVHWFGIEGDRLLSIGVSDVARRSWVDAVEVDNDNDSR